MPVTTSIYLDKSHPGKDGKCGVTVRITYNRKNKYFKTDVRLTPEDFEKVMGAKPRGNFKDIALDLQAKEARAQEVIKDLPLFSFQAFTKRYRTDKQYEGTIDNAFITYANQLRLQGRIGSAVSYECAGKSFAGYKTKVLFTDVTSPFLEGYEKWMLNKNNSYTTIGIYVRNLRCLFNTAIFNGDLHRDYYPFGKRKYEIPSSANKKKALTLTELESIFEYKPLAGSNTEKFLDFWKFCYLNNGCNLKDLALLKYKNIKGNFIEFHRSKTQISKRKVELIRAALTDETKAIIERHGNPDKLPDNYVFTILKKDESPERVYQLIQQFVGLVNDHMKIVAKQLNIDKPVTSYAARHSFSTILMRSGFSTEMISKALGHSNIKTTAAYLGSFEDEAILAASKALTAFKTERSDQK